MQKVSRRLWGLRLRRTVPGLALASRQHVAFRQSENVGVLVEHFRSSIPSPPIPLFTLRDAPRGTPRKTRGRVVRYSFLVRNFHSLLSAGLSRRPRPPFFGVCDFPEGLGGNKKVRCPGSEVRGLEGSGQWRVARNRRGPLAGDANDRLFAPARLLRLSGRVLQRPTSRDGSRRQGDGVLRLPPRQY